MQVRARLRSSPTFGLMLKTEAAGGDKPTGHFPACPGLKPAADRPVLQLAMPLRRQTRMKPSSSLAAQEIVLSTDSPWA